MGERDKTNGGRADEGGFTLIELIVALAVLAVVLGAALPAMYSALNLSRNNRNRSIAAGLASQEIDIVRDTAASNFPALGSGPVPSTQVVDGITYKIDREGEWVAPGATSSACSGSAATSPSFLRITVFVTWPDMRGVPAVQNQTILAPPAGSFDPYKVAIGVSVRDRLAQPEGSITATATLTTTPFTSLAVATGTDGCAYLAGLAPGTYAVTLSKAGYVDGSFNPTATTNVTLAAGNAVQVSFDYDQAAVLSATFASAAGVVPAAVVPAGVPITVYNIVRLSPLGTKVLNGVTPAGSPRLVPNIFPDSSGYKTWAGDCADADPEGRMPPASPPGPAYYPGQFRNAPFAVTPGGTTPYAFILPSVDVKVMRGAAVVPGATITALHAIDLNSCTSGDSLALTTLTSAAGTLRIALPYGTWTFKATQGTTATGGSVTLTPTTVGVPAVTVTIP